MSLQLKSDLQSLQTLLSEKQTRSQELERLSTRSLDEVPVAELEQAIAAKQLASAELDRNNAAIKEIQDRIASKQAELNESRKSLTQEYKSLEAQLSGAIGKLRSDAPALVEMSREYSDRLFEFFELYQYCRHYQTGIEALAKELGFSPAPLPQALGTTFMQNGLNQPVPIVLKGGESGCEFTHTGAFLSEWREAKRSDKVTELKRSA